MLKDITTIKLSGANFGSQTPLCFFDPHDGDKIKTIKGTLLYGKNGTGKSTIARAFQILAGEAKPNITSAALFDDAGQPITLTEEEKKHLFIFNEDYVDKNVRLQQDHLETIVMLGQAADLTDKIKKAVEERDEAKTAYEEQSQVYNEYSDASNVRSPKHYVTLLVNALRGDDNWAGRDRKINIGQKNNTSVKDDTYKKFTKINPSKPKTEFIMDFEAKLMELEDANTGASSIDTKVPTIPDSYSIYDDRAVQLALSEKIEKPILSEREKKLFGLVQDRKLDELSQRLTVFRKEETVECPYCYQSMTKDHKKSLVASIEKVLSKEVEDHQKDLRSKTIEQLYVDLNPYEKLDGYQACVDLMAEINAAIQKINDNLEMKIANPYEPIIIKAAGIKTKSDQLIPALEILEQARSEYNEATKKTGPIIKELNRINSEIAHYDVVNLAEQYDKQLEEYTAAEALLNELKKEYDEKKLAVEDLEAERKSTHIACSAINACMKYIFFAEDRLEIKNVDGVYKLLSHGNSVKPCDVSVGERNIIALCYFFTNILEGQDEKDAYKDEYLLVIDDPVCSYDIENRIGILSFLKYKLSEFLEGNENTKALVMTHDLMTFYDVHKILEEIVTACDPKGYPHDPKFNRFEMSENGLKPFSYNKRQEYTEIVKTVFAYASGEAHDYELVIGNMMRQALEAFSTFEYKKGIKDVSTDPQILAQLPEPEYASYYKNLMYRLVLHGGSHKEEEIRAMKDFRFFSIISAIEKKKTARDVLCFIYLLNKRHMLEHLKGCKNVKDELETWCEAIKRRAAVV